MEVEVNILDQTLKFDVPDELYTHIEEFAAKAKIPVEQAIATALMMEWEEQEKWEPGAGIEQGKECDVIKG